MNDSALNGGAATSTATAEFLRSDFTFDLARLAAEIATARGMLDFDKGPYGGGISLPTADDVPPHYRTHHNNLPFVGVFERCPYFRHVFDSFQCTKVTFRLLIRRAHSAYALHDDKDKGDGIVRFQIPIIADDLAFMVIPKPDMRFDFVDVEAAAAAPNGDIPFDMAKLDRLAEGRFDLFTLDPGFLYWFDTDHIHTLVNASDEDRIVLSLDVIENDWLAKWMQAELTRRLPPSPVERSASIRWNWSALRHGVIRTD